MSGRMEPRLEYRAAQAYVGMRRRVTMGEIAVVLPPLHAGILAWLRARGEKPAGAPFWRYLVVDMESALEIDVAFPVAASLPGDERVVADVLPGGTFATCLHVGHPDGLMKATARLLSWAERSGVDWKMNGGRWEGRVERYLSDPAREPDMSTWRTELAFLTTRESRSQSPKGGR